MRPLCSFQIPNPPHSKATEGKHVDGVIQDVVTHRIENARPKGGAKTGVNKRISLATWATTVERVKIAEKSSSVTVGKWAPSINPNRGIRSITIKQKVGRPKKS